MASFHVDLSSFRRDLGRVARSQVPFAAALALNDTAEEIEAEWKEEFRRKLDRPTPFTMRGFYRRRASKSRLVAEIGLKRLQAEYLRLQMTGGERRPKRKALVVPAGIRLNKYGNIARGAVGKTAARSDTFVASSSSGRTRHLKPGIYQRPRARKRKASPAAPKMLVAFNARARYRRRLHLGAVALRTVRRRMPVHFSRRFAMAMATAR